MKNRSAVLALTALSLCCVAAIASSADKVRTVNEGGIRDQWMLADGVKLAMPTYPVEFAKAEPRDVCLALGYQINPDGSTSDFRVLKQWNSQTEAKEPVDGFFGGFAQSGADAVAQWKFKPRPEVAQPTPTFTVATLTWQTVKGSDGAALRAHCKIDDLVAHLKEMTRKGGLNDHLIDRDNRARNAELQRRAGTPQNSRSF
jgi:hypothetical protein